MRRVLVTAAMAAAALGVGTVGPAAAAHAADLPKVADLGGLTAVDPGSVGTVVDGTARRTTALAGEAGGKAVRKEVPRVGRTGGTAVKKTVSTVQRVVGTAAGSAGEAVGETMKSATEGGGLPAQGLRSLRAPGIG
ncbi:ATP-binding protein [Streptomyces sp. NPDC053048]|uniref:ATP-binding protein n=1 Tax=Streptomyces sp. NPDC053048 TaxID=3365694 RepID=UPI0037D2E54E